MYNLKMLYGVLDVEHVWQYILMTDIVAIIFIYPSLLTGAFSALALKASVHISLGSHFASEVCYFSNLINLSLALDTCDLILHPK